tara:strand:- start:4805 stop:5467 length:663 start_codon:yes stop_codon:yes gene_type:complete
MSISNWEEAKKRSKYHFSTSIIDTTNIQSLGKFRGDWKKDLEFALGCVEKINWGNRRAAADRPNDDIESEEYDLIKAGANPKMTIYRGLTDFSKCPTIQKMIDFFELKKDVKAKLHIQFTGDVLNMHIDKLYDLNPFGSANDVIRIMVMLEDWQPGQFIIYGNQTYTNWKAGDIHKFDWMNIPHATANASLYPRPMLVITGVMTLKTKEIISTQLDHYLT